MAGFALILMLSLLPGRKLHLISRGLALVAGLVGIALICVQLFVIEHVCSLCMLVDAAGVLLSILAMSLRPDQARFVWLRLPAWIVAGCAAAALPIGWARLIADPPTPPQVTSHWVAGKINVIEVTDFDCPHCARFEPIMTEALRGVPNCRFVRIPCPMPKHENARPAARAFLAASRQGKGEEMAAALFAAESRDASECRKLARRLGLDLAEYDRGVADPATDAQLDETIAWARQTGPGLPMVWVQGRFFPKAPSLAALRNAFNQVVPFQPVLSPQSSSKSSR